MATSVIWHQILLLHSCSLVYSTNKKHWKCLWLFTLETFLTVYQQRPPDGYPIMHDLHSSKKFLEFGLLYYHKPLIYIPYLKEAFTKPITSVFFFLVMVIFLKWKTCISSSTTIFTLQQTGTGSSVLHEHFFKALHHVNYNGFSSLELSEHLQRATTIPDLF